MKPARAYVLSKNDDSYAQYFFPNQELQRTFTLLNSFGTPDPSITPGDQRPLKFTKAAAYCGEFSVKCTAWDMPPQVLAIWSIPLPWNMVDDDDDNDCEDLVYLDTDGQYSDADAVTLALADYVEQRNRVQRAQAMLLNGGNPAVARRETIPDDAKLFVWRRDEGRCTRCGSDQLLEFDHIIPLAKGGSNTTRNLQLLCERCNRSKGARLA